MCPITSISTASLFLYSKTRIILLLVLLYTPLVSCNDNSNDQNQTNASINNQVINNIRSAATADITGQQQTKTTNETIDQKKVEVCVQVDKSGGCLKCVPGYYLDLKAACAPIDPLCKENNDQGLCIKCYDGYTLKSGRCTLGSQADPACKSYTNGVCTQCFSGFYISPTTKLCRKVNPLCKKSNSQTGACTDCFSGYIVNSQKGTCEIFIKDQNCKQYSADRIKCIECNDRYYFNQKTNQCSQVHPLCKSFDNLTGKCTDCFPGYLVRSGLCVVGNSVDNRCKVRKPNGCAVCFDGYYPSNQGKCQPVDPLCKTYNLQNGLCTGCYQSYQLTDPGQCKLKQQIDKYCSKTKPQNPKICQQCYKGYSIIQGICRIQDSSCKKTGTNQKKCTQCWQGYQLIGDTCNIRQIRIQVSNDIYCMKSSNGSNGSSGQCQKCSDGYFINQSTRKCQEVSNLCNGYDSNDGKCLACFDGYRLSQGKCVAEVEVIIPYCQQAQNGVCQECIQGYYLEGNQCKAVSILCSQYNKNTGKCLGCIAGYYFQDNDCIYPAIYQANCLRYDGGFCSKCKQGFYINSYTCKPIDSKCFKFNYDTSTCQQCVDGLVPREGGCQ